MTNIDTAAARRAWEKTTQGEWRITGVMTGHKGDVFAPTARRIQDCHHIARCYAPKPEKSPACTLQVMQQSREAIAVIEANARFIARAHSEYPALLDEIERLRGELAKANGAQWFYLGDDCGSDQCRFSIDECIDEDFLHYNRAEGSHVVLISGARPVPDMWLALKFFTEEEKDEREDDEPYTFTIHGSEEAARTALGEKA